MIKYFQLTPEILLEYLYEGDPKMGENGNKKDISDEYPTILLKSDAFTSKYLCFKNESEGFDSISNLVLPLNNTETQFVVAKSNYQNFYSRVNTSNYFWSQNGSGYVYDDTNYDKDINESCDVKYDKCIIHFTSRNYFGNYDSLIFQAYAYMKNKAKLYFASFLFKKTSNICLEAEQMLYNGKLYTKRIEIDIPSVFAIFAEKNKTPEKRLPFVTALESQNIELLENTPIGINVYGVSGSIMGTDNYERLKTLKISSISIPYIYNRFDEIHVNISEAQDGDYYNIDPDIGDEYTSFVDYIERMGEDIRSYMVMHELSLWETWVEDDVTYTETTHKEYHIIDINEDDEDEEISKRFDAKIKYRPICMHSGSDYIATIIDKIKIINTVDKSLYEVTGSLEISNPHKYGLKLKRLNMKDDSRPIVNVYNKKVSDENESRNMVSLNKSKGFIVENKTQNITSFIEATNIGVSIVELSPEDIY